MISRYEIIIIIGVASMILIPTLALMNSTDGMKDSIVSPTLPSRTIFQETEGNNNWATANNIPISVGNTLEVHGNLSNGNDFDFYYFSMNGGAGPVDKIEVIPNYINASDQYDYFVGWLWGFYPNDAMSSADSNGVSLAIDIWYPTQIWQGIHAYASYSGNYGLIIRPLDQTEFSGKMSYNFTLTMSSQTPKDSSNDVGSSQTLSSSSGQISTDLDMDEDLFDWYKLTAPNSLHPTVLSLNFNLVNPFPSASISGIDYGVGVDIIIKYDDRNNNPGVFHTDVYKISQELRFQTLLDYEPTPYQLTLIQNCTEMKIGIMIEFFGVTSSGGVSYTPIDAYTGYNLGYSYYAKIPNKRPILVNGKVSPLRGTSSDIYEFTVTYMDENNNTPVGVYLYLDGQFLKDMTASPGEGSDFSVGVEYSVKVLGSTIGSDREHTFNFSAHDQEHWAFIVGEQVKDGPIVDDNLPPEAIKPVELVQLEEDSKPTYLDLAPLFDDPNPGTQLEYRLVKEEGEKATQLNNRNFTATIQNNGSVESPEWVLKVMPKPDVYGVFSFLINASDRDPLYPKYTELEIRLNIAPTNDDPIIRYVRVDSENYDLDNILDWERDQGARIEMSIIGAEDPDGDELSFDCDIDEVLYGPKKGVNYDWDPDTGEGWFVTGDDDVPGFEFTITVSDGKGGDLQLVLEFDVINVNDPPVIWVPEGKSTIENEKLIIIPTWTDPDLDNGDVLEFYVDFGDLELVAPTLALDWDVSTGKVVIDAVNEEMNGVWEVNISVRDPWGGLDWGICRITIENVNDIPVAREISPGLEEGNLTVDFYTSDASDEDGDQKLTYIWNFGDGSDLVSGIDLTSVEHVYPRGGVYTVTLKVFDGVAHSDEVTEVVRVTDPPLPEDMDGDGMLDSWELEFGLDPTDPLDAGEDPDGDGLNNSEEYLYYLDYGQKINPMNPDSDGDGWKDGEEIDRNYDPLDPSEHPELGSEQLAFILWILVVLVVILAVLFPLLFIVMRIRNRPKAVASMAPPPVMPGEPGGQYLPPQEQQQLSGQYYEQLPPAEGYDDQGTYQQEQQYYQEPPTEPIGMGVQEYYQEPPTEPIGMGGQEYYQEPPPEPIGMGVQEYYQEPPPDPAGMGEQEHYQEPPPEPIGMGEQGSSQEQGDVQDQISTMEGEEARGSPEMGKPDPEKPLPTPDQGLPSDGGSASSESVTGQTEDGIHSEGGLPRPPDPPDI